MAYVYFTDSRIKPYALARMDVPDSETLSFDEFWGSPGERWLPNTGVWRASDTVVSDIFATGEWEPIPDADVPAAQRDILININTP